MYNELDLKYIHDDDDGCPSVAAKELQNMKRKFTSVICLYDPSFLLNFGLDFLKISILFLSHL